MPWGYECRDRLVKQRITQPTKRTNAISQEIELPGPNHYEHSVVFGGPGYSKIKRLPAYTFGIVTKPIHKPVTKPNAPIFNVRGMGPKGTFRIPGGIIRPHIEEPVSTMKTPGPGTYVPRGDSRYKRPPAFSIRQVTRPPYQPWDMWTPPPNMYLPPSMNKRPPAYSLGSHVRPAPISLMPGPGTHEPNYDFVKKKKPAFSFGYPFRPERLPTIPAPNTYCERKFNVSKRSAPAPSFGIRHSQYLGKQAVYMKPSNLKIQIAGAT